MITNLVNEYLRWIEENVVGEKEKAKVRHFKNLLSIFPEIPLKTDCSLMVMLAEGDSFKNGIGLTYTISIENINNGPLVVIANWYRTLPNGVGDDLYKEYEYHIDSTDKIVEFCNELGKWNSQFVSDISIKNNKYKEIEIDLTIAST